MFWLALNVQPINHSEPYGLALPCTNVDCVTV